MVVDTIHCRRGNGSLHVGHDSDKLIRGPNIVVDTIHHLCVIEEIEVSLYARQDLHKLVRGAAVVVNLVDNMCLKIA